MDLNVHYEKIVSNFAAWRDAERQRASDAGETRAEIGKLLELTGLNKKAVSFVRALDKMEEEKRDDVLRSLTSLLDLMDRAWNGNKTPDMFDDDQPAVEPASEGPRKPSYQPDPDFAGEVDDFDRHLAEVMPEGAE